MSENYSRKGIISVGNWVVDAIKFIEVYPAKGNLTSILSVDEGLGGCAHNVLADIASLGSDIPLYAGGCIGSDDHGKMCLDAIKRLGINGDNMTVLPGVATSYTDVMTEMKGGFRTFFHHRGANAKLDVEKVLSCDSPARIFHLGYLLLLDELEKEDPEFGVAASRALAGLKEKGYKTSVDVVSEEGDRYRKVILPCLKYTDYLIINEVEAGNCLGMSLRDAQGHITFSAAEAAARELLALGVNDLVVIHFPEGGVAVSADGRSAVRASESPDPSQIVSTVGAGDAFCAGVLYSIHEGFDLDRMLLFANTSARFNLFSATSTGGAPTLKQVEEYMKTRI